MAARISNDDWGNLDGITKRVAGLSSGIQGTLNRTGAAFLEGVNITDWGSWVTSRPEDVEFLEKFPPLIARMMQIQAGAIGVPLEAVSKVAGGLTKAVGPFVEGTYSGLT